MSLHRYELLGTSVESYTGNDFSTGADTAAVVIFATETAVGIESPLAPYVIESGVWTETVRIDLSIADTASFDDLYAHPPAAMQANVVTEAGAVTSVYSLVVRGFEVGTRTEVGTVFATLTIADAGIGTEAGGQNWSAVDTATGIELALAPYAGDFGAWVDVINRDLPLSESGTLTEAQGDRVIALFDDAIYYEDVFDLAFILFEDGLAFDEATWGLGVDDYAVATDSLIGGRIRFEDSNASEIALVVAVVSSLDSGVGFEYSPDGPIALLDPVSDSGTGSDSMSVGSDIASADSGVGSDTNSPTWFLDELPAGVDVVLVLSDNTCVDAATAAFELVDIVAVTDLGADSGAGFESGSLSADFLLADSFTLSENTTDDFVVSELAAGVEAGEADADIVCADAGVNAYESGTVAALLDTVADSGLLVETGYLNADCSLSDTSPTGSDELQPIWDAEEFPAADDEAVLSVVTTDLGSFAEFVIAPLALDGGTGLEATLYGPAIEESATGVDAVNAIDVSYSDSATGVEFPLMGLASDAGSFIDSLFVSNLYGDFSTGSEVVTINAALDTAADTSTVIYEATQLDAVLDPASDSGALVEAGAVTNDHGGSDSGTGSDDVTSFTVTFYELEPDAAELTEDAELDVVLTLADTDSSGSESAFWLPQGAYISEQPLKDTRLDEEFQVLG